MEIPSEVLQKILEAHQLSAQALLPLYDRASLHIVIHTQAEPDAPWRERVDEAFVGQISSYKRDFQAVARAKVATCIRHRADTSAVLQYPAQLAPGDCLWAGGVYYPGLVVACSGAPAIVDEQIARGVALAIITWQQFELKRLQDVALAEGRFVLA